MKKKKRDDVGYCRPPAETQFKPGQSGNSKGRPKGSKNMLTQLQEILSSKVTVTDESGNKIKMNRLSVILTQTVNKGMKGDMKAVSTLMPYIEQIDLKNEEKDKIINILKTDDKNILKNFLDRKGDDNDDKRV
jgi:hypothetical protein